MLGLMRFGLSAAAALYLASFAGLATLQRDMLYRPTDRIVTPAKAGLSDVAETHIRSADGTRLVAWRRAAQPNKPLILYFHGNSGNLADRAERFRLFAAEGWGLFAIAWRGFGGSEGAPTQEGLMQDGDAAYAEARRLGYGPKDIVVMGESLGTGVAVAVAARHEAAALVLDSPYLSVLDVAAGRYWMFPVDLVMRDTFRSDLAIGAVRIPVFMTHGEQDAVIPIDSARRLFALANEPKTFVAAPQGGHLVLARPEVFPQARDWIAKAAARADSRAAD